MTESQGIQVIVGLGNPGEKYLQTRHNAGFWFADAAADRFGGSLRQEKRFFGESCQLQVAALQCRLLKPMLFMNRSGQAVAALCNFFKLEPQQLLVVHDELDLPPGVVRFKQGGGHGGHNGLRDIHKAVGADYCRLRIGIGHPGHKSQVVDYVLRRASRGDEALIRDAIAGAVEEIPDLLAGDYQRVMNRLHQ
ncbi:MAG: aminoacyl-tRNA hydrolase [Pseudomonadota bacterium]